MKKFHPNLLKRVVGNPAPKPFPGIWPTRWVIGVVYWDDQLMEAGKHRTFSYHGKPNYLIANKLTRIQTQKFGRGRFLEYDRNGIIAEARDFGLPILKVRPSFVTPLLQFYQPWQGGSELISCWGRGRNIIPWKFIWKGKKWICYSAGPVDVYNREAQLAWLKGQKFDGLI